MLILCILIIKWNENTFFTLKGDFFFILVRLYANITPPTKIYHWAIIHLHLWALNWLLLVHYSAVRVCKVTAGSRGP